LVVCLIAIRGQMDETASESTTHISDMEQCKSPRIPTLCSTIPTDVVAAME